MARRRSMAVFGLSFLDAMTCGLGAVVLLYMVINASVGVRADQATSELKGEVSELEDEVLEGTRNLVELRNAVAQIERRHVVAQGLSRRLIEQVEEIEAELASYGKTNLAQRSHVNRLKTDIQTLEEESKRLSAKIKEDEEQPGQQLRAFVGDGDRQYLTGLKVGGDRVLILVDTSGSMLGETVVDVLRRRNMPDNVKIRADKWRRTVLTVEWLISQMPTKSAFQIYGFNERSGAVLQGTDGKWLSAGSQEDLDRSAQALRETIPDGGTSLYRAFAAAKRLRPEPDNLILIVDGLPTIGDSPPSKNTVDGKKRLKLFEQAQRIMPQSMPINIILMPMEGDPMAAPAYWKMAQISRGSFLAPAKDWP